MSTTPRLKPKGFSSTKNMKKLLLLIFCSAALQAQTVVTNIVYVTNTVVYTRPAPVVYTRPAPVVYVQPAPVVYTQPAPVVIYQPPTIVYESSPMIVSPLFVPQPYFYYPHHHHHHHYPHYYHYKPSVRVGIRFGHH